MAALVHTFVLLGALQGAVLSAILARRQQNPLANTILSALVAALALMLALGYLDTRWGFSGFPHLIALGTPLPFLFAPLLYLYVRALTEPLQRLQPRALVHGLPFVANVIFMAEAFYFKGGAEKLSIAERYVAGDMPASVEIFQVVMVVQAVAYLAASFVVLRRYRKRIRDFFSDLHRIDLQWLMVLVLGNAAVWCLVALSAVLQSLSLHVDMVETLRPAVQLGSAAMVFLIGYISLWQPDLFNQARLARTAERAEPDMPAKSEKAGTPDAAGTPRDEAGTPRDEAGTPDDEAEAKHATSAPTTDAQQRSVDEPSRASYARNKLEAEDADEISEQLRALVGQKELYRDPTLTLQTLADSLGVPRHTLSQVLNTHVGQSFYAFVNGHRAEALKTALATPALRERGVLELALEAGFNSKSTANSVFKSHTGMTPTQYRARSLDRETKRDASAG